MRKAKPEMKRIIVFSGCLWLLSLLLILPIVWLGLAYGYSLEEWLMLVEYPNDSEENALWLYRIVLLSILFVTSYIIVRALIKENAQR